MVKNSLPEHTVDCWVGSAITDAIPDALYWAPTQRGLDNWDEAFTLGRGKALLFENKGTHPRSPTSSRHSMRIDIKQLHIYLTSVTAPVFYILPSPPWPANSGMDSTSAGRPLPPATRCRTGSSCASMHPGSAAHGGFPLWASVISELDLLRWLASRKPLRGPRGVRTIHPEDLLSIASRKGGPVDTLEAFLLGATRCTHGGVAYADATSARHAWVRRKYSIADEVAYLFGIEASANDDRLEVNSEAQAMEVRRSGILAAFLPVV